MMDALVLGPARASLAKHDALVQIDAVELCHIQALNQMPRA